jgi:cytochrome c oxidase cbb3-type subunit III
MSAAASFCRRPFGGWLLALAAAACTGAAVAQPFALPGPGGLGRSTPSRTWIQPGPPASPASPAPSTTNQQWKPGTAAIQEGERLFGWFNCSGCHGGQGGGGWAPSLRDSQWIYGDDPVSIYDSIWQGRPQGMPTWGGRIPDQQIWNLVAYIRSLGKAGDASTNAP